MRIGHLLHLDLKSIKKINFCVFFDVFLPSKQNRGSTHATSADRLLTTWSNSIYIIHYHCATV